MQIFVSCVSKEFRGYRTALRAALAGPARDVKIQEDFQHGGAKLLAKLDNYLARCDAVVHLVGDGTGECAKPAEVRWVLDAYPDFKDKLPELAPWLTPEGCPFTYTQWECYLAIYHRVPCFVYLADAQSAREPDWTATADSCRAQQAHVERLRSLGQERLMTPFADARDLAIGFLNALLDSGAQVPARPVAGRVVQWPPAIALPDYALADREPEFRRFRALASGEDRPRILLLHGPSDRGKTVLLAQLFETARRIPGLHAAFGEFKTALPLHQVLETLRHDLKPLRLPRFDRELAGQRRPETLAAVFLDDLEESGEPAVLLLDAFEQADEDAKRWIECRLLPRCRQYDGLRLIVAGQQVPQASGPLAAVAERRELRPICDTAPWCDYFRRVLKGDGVSDDHLQTLVRAAQGSPRTISLLLGNLADAEAQS